MALGISLAPEHGAAVNDFDVIVVGGGIAGSAVATELSRKGWRVLVLEKKRLPNHKLCGEFLSGESRRQLENLGAIDFLLNAGARRIDRFVLTTSRGAVFRSTLPEAALGLSRYRLDVLLRDAAAVAGADFRDGLSALEIKGSLCDGFVVKTAAGAYRASVVVGAFGKRSSLDVKMGRRFASRLSPYVAYKQHFLTDSFPGAIELHAFDGGYCGVSPIEAGRVNVCLIAHSAFMHRPKGALDLAGLPILRTNPRLAARLDSMIPEKGTLCAVASPSLEDKGKFDEDICMVGDAAGMIAPLCGDGMAMALSSAEIASMHIDGFLRGQISSSKLKSGYTASWNREFALRIKLGRIAQTSSLYPWFADLLTGACAVSPRFGRWLIARTRGASGQRPVLGAVLADS